MSNHVVDDKLFNFILDNVKTLRNIEDLPENATPEQTEEYEKLINIISLFIDSTCQEIIIKTNRTKFPEDLKYLAIDIVNDMYGQFLSDTNPDANNVIQSMSEDGRSVNFGASSFSQTKMQLLIQQKLNDNEALIKRYRLLYKVVCPYEKQN